MQRFNNITRILISSFLLLHIAFLSNAQEGKNPFDLDHRLKEKKEQTTEKNDAYNENPFDLTYREKITLTTPETPSIVGKDKNPFDLSKQKIAVSTAPGTLTEKPKSENPFDISKTSGEPSVSENKTIQSGKPIQKENKSQDEASGFIFWAILLMMIFLGLEITLFNSLLNKVYRAFTNDNILKLLHREQRDIVSIPLLLLYIFFFVNFGIFSFLTLNYYGFVPKSLANLMYCIGGIGFLFFLKHISLKFVELVFPFQKEIKQYSFSLVIFSSILGFALVPFNVVMAFASPFFVKAALYGGLITIFGLTAFCILRGVFIASKYLSFHKFHFFMYLCTVEIAPALMVLKILLLRAGIH